MSHKHFLRVTGAFVFLIAFAFTLLFFQTLPSSVAAAGPATDPPSKQKTPPKPEAAKTAPPGSTIHTVTRGETLPGVAYRYLPETPYMTDTELETAIRRENPEIKGIWLKPGSQVIIPDYMPMPWTEKSRLAPKDFEVRAVYLTGTMAGSAHGLDIIRKWRAVGGNSVVFDIKDSDGSLSVPFEGPLVPHRERVPIRNLAKLTRYIHSLGMHAIARIAIFKDDQLVARHPELAVRSRRTGKPWLENNKLAWADPSLREVQDYNIALAKYAAANGADEIQFDYVRFPTESDQKDAKFAYETEHPTWKRSDVITNFLQRADGELKPMGVLFSLDVFGIMGWQRTVDLVHTGQDIPQMAKYCDVLSPMIYPSHFFGMDGVAHPGDAPEHFISESMDRFVAITKGTGVVIRPWLQAFAWRTKTYSPDYIMVQVRVAREHGGDGFLFWNAGNDYSKPFAAMPTMRAAKNEYFRGDEVGDPQANPSAPVATAAPQAAIR